MQTDKKSFARLVNANRAALIKYYAALSGISAVEASTAITQQAVQKNYIERKSPPPGSALKDWYGKNNAPQWACRAAFDLLVSLGWRPVTYEDKAVSARYLTLNGYSLSSEWQQLLGEWITVSTNINKRLSNDSK